MIDELLEADDDAERVYVGTARAEGSSRVRRNCAKGDDRTGHSQCGDELSQSHASPSLFGVVRGSSTRMGLVPSVKAHDLFVVVLKY